MTSNEQQEDHRDQFTCREFIILLLGLNQFAELIVGGMPVLFVNELAQIRSECK